MWVKGQAVWIVSWNSSDTRHRVELRSVLWCLPTASWMEATHLVIQSSWHIKLAITVPCEDIFSKLPLFLRKTWPIQWYRPSSYKVKGLSKGSFMYRVYSFSVGESSAFYFILWVHVKHQENLRTWICKQTFHVPSQQTYIKHVPWTKIGGGTKNMNNTSLCHSQTQSKFPPCWNSPLDYIISRLLNYTLNRSFK